MERPETPEAAPSPERFAEVFAVYEVREDGDRIYYFGRPLVDHDRLVQAIWPAFEEAGYEVNHVQRTGEDILVAQPAEEPGIDGIPWTNVVLFVLTVFSTLFAGAMWFHVDVTSNPTEIWKGWPFAVAIMTVLGVHELGHYVMSRYHGVNASLPYFIPIPTLIGTMGAVIKMKGHMPNRKALFDIGVAGPLAGLVATVVITVVGLFLGPVTAPEWVMESDDAVQIALGFPPLMEFLAWATGQPLYFPNDPAKSVHPVVVGGWVGMFVTFLNMIPVGQLDGGHIIRSMAGDYQETVAAAVPGLLFALAGYLYLLGGHAFQNVFVWVFWGLLATVVALVGPATPINDEEKLDTKRKLIGIATFVLGLLCFTPVPIAVMG